MEALLSQPRIWKFYKTTYAQICVEMDFNKRFPIEINLTDLDYVWV